MTETILPIVLAATFVKTLLVADAVLFSGIGVSIFAQIAQTICPRTSQAPTSPRSVSSQAPTSPRSVSPLGGGASKTKTLHGWLLVMHFTAVINQGAVVAQHFLPLSEISCVVTHRTMAVFNVLFDAAMVMFLLAKALVVIGNRILAWWEKIIIWWSRMYSCVFRPLTAVYLGVTLPVSVTPERLCVRSLSGVPLTINTLLFSTHQILLAIQGVLLLEMFIRPLLGRAQGMQTGGSLYRRVVLRNVICTLGIIVVYAVKSIVVRTSAKSNQTSRDLIRAFSGIAVLILTETTLPIGFSSLLKALPMKGCCEEDSRKKATTSLAGGGSKRSRNAIAGTRTGFTNAKVAVALTEPSAEMP